MLSRFSFAALVILGGLFAGAAGGFLMSTQYVFPQLQSLQRSMVDYLDQATSTRSSPVEVVRVEREPAAPIIPAIFLQGRRSPLLSLIRKSTHPTESELLTKDRFIGQLVSLTVDGWLLAPASLFDGVRLADVEVLSEGRVYPIREAIRDTATDLVYVKIAAQNLPVVGFTQIEDVVVGLPVWIEVGPARFVPQVVLDVRDRAFTGPAPSERISRRYLVQMNVSPTAKGGAVWNGAGQLVGVVDASDPTGTRIIPAVEAMAVLTPLLATHEIRRTTLGVAGLDTSLLFSEASSSAFALSGFVVRGDRAHGLVAVDPKGPAAKVLKEGDVIERLDRDGLSGAVDLGEYLAQYRPGTSLTLHGRRNGKPFEGLVVLGSVVTSELIK